MWSVGVGGFGFSCREIVSKTTSDNGGLSPIGVKRVRNARRKRLEIRRMRPKCQSEAGVGVGDGRGTKSNAEECSTEISISFSSPSSSENDAIPAKETESFPPPSYGTVSVIDGGGKWRMR